MIPFNDVERALSLLDQNRADIACVLVDPVPHRVGLSPANVDFVRALREWSSTNDALLVFDEVITFRSEYGGAQEWYGIRPDLTALGKVIGGGFPVGALAGRADVMEVINPLADRVLFPHSGTFSANPVTMTAGLVAMELFDRDAVALVNRLAERAIEGIRGAIAATGVAACVTSGGSLFRVHLKEQPPRNYREAFAGPEETARRNFLIDHLFESGFMMINTCSATISTPMGEAEIDALVEAFADGFERLSGSS